MRALRSTFLVGALIVLTMSLPSVVFAATAFPALKSLDAITGTSSGGQGTLSIKGELPDGTALPAKVVVPIPKGAQPVWVGEILGSDPSRDPTATYTIQPGSSYDLLTITLTRVRVGQAEFSTTYATKGGATLYAQTLPIPGKVAVATISIIVPSGSKVSSLTPGLALGAKNGGSDVYSVATTSPPPDTTLTAGLEAVSPATSGTPTGQPGVVATAAAGAASSGGNPSALTPIWVLLYAIAAAFLGYNAWKYMQGKRAPKSDANADIPPARKDADRHEPVREERVKTGQPKKTEQPKKTGKSRKSQPPDTDPVDEIVAATTTPAEEERHDAAIEVDSDAPEPAGEAAETAPERAEHANGVLTHIKALAALKTGGLLETDEYAAAKGVVLSGESRMVPLLEELAAFKTAGLLTPSEFSLAKTHLLTGSGEVITQIEELAALQAEDLLTREEFQAVVDQLLDS